MRKRTAHILALAIAVALPFSASAHDEAKTLLQQALFAEEAEQKLDKAAENYEKVIATYQNHRDYAVAALFRLAEVRRKQQRKKEAADLYQRIANEFPKAEPQARLSREALKAMGIKVAAEAGPAAIAPVDPGEEKELRRFQMLIENNPEKVWATKFNPIAQPSSAGWSRVVELLLEHAKTSGKDMTDFLPTALSAAVANSHLELAATLIERGAKIEHASDGLVHAIITNNDTVANWLIEAGVDINKTSFGHIAKDKRPRGFSAPMSPLAAAIVADNKPWVDRFLELGADINAVADGSQSISALSIACWKGHLPLAKKLLTLGADPNLANKSHLTPFSGIRSPPVQGSGWTPLHYAADQPELVAALLEAGAKASTADDLGITPLHCACLSPNVESMRLLLDAGADPSTFAKYWEGNPTRPYLQLTPLMIASMSNDSPGALAAIDLLIAKGADIYAKNDKGSDVFELCSIADTCTVLSRRFIYPRISEKRSVTLAFPASNALFEFTPAADAGDAAAPPSLKHILTQFPSDRLMRDPRQFDTWWGGFDWQQPTLWRRSPEPGGFVQTTIDIPSSPVPPQLQWGDIIEIDCVPVQRSEHRRDEYPTKLIGHLLSGQKIRDKSFYLPVSIWYALEASETAKVTLQFPDEKPRQLDLGGGIVVSNPFAKFALQQPSELLKSFLAKDGRSMSSFEHTRAAKEGEPTEPVQYGDYPRDGDLIKVTKLAYEYTRSNTIQLVEPRTQTRLYSLRVPSTTRFLPTEKVKTIRLPSGKTRVVAPAKPALPKTSRYRNRMVAEAKRTATTSRGGSTQKSDFEGCSEFPTLVQFLASAYDPLPIRQVRYLRSSGLDQEWANLAYSFCFTKEPPVEVSDADIRYALAACMREHSVHRTIMPHPDFATIRIHRLPEKEGPDEIIEVPLGKIIAACTAKTPGAECRKHDIELMAGDIVELPAIYDQLAEPFSGFDEATARFFSKVLSYDLKFAPSPGAPTVRMSKKWRAPQFYDTSAGLVGVVNSKDAIHPDPNHRYPGYYFDLLGLVGSQLTTSNRKNLWLREGATVKESTLRKSRSQFERNTGSGPAFSSNSSTKREEPVRVKIILSDTP